MESIQEDIENRLEEEFQPAWLEIVNESHLHAGHKGHDGGGESHFSVKICATAFRGLSRVEAHKRVYAVLDDLFKKGLHALRLDISD